MKTINTLKQLYKLTADNQTTAQEIINRRTYINNSWEDVELSKDFIYELAEEVSNLLGGYRTTKLKVKNTLLHSRPQHWGLSRVILSYYDGSYFWEYIAGQDYTSELNTIRTALK